MIEFHHTLPVLPKKMVGLDGIAPPPDLEVITIPYSTFTVGQPLPLPFGEGVRVALAGTSFTVLGFFSGLQPHEAKAWRKGKLKYGVYIEAAIPWMLFDLAGFGDFDATLNLLLESQEKRDQFLAGEPLANLVTLICGEFPSGIVRGIRAVGLEPVVLADIKSACFDQLTRYSSAQALDQARARIEYRMTSAQMRARAGMRKL